MTVSRTIPDLCATREYIVSQAGSLADGRAHSYPASFTSSPATTRLVAVRAIDGMEISQSAFDRLEPHASHPWCAGSAFALHAPHLQLPLRKVGQVSLAIALALIWLLMLVASNFNTVAVALGLMLALFVLDW